MVIGLFETGLEMDVPDAWMVDCSSDAIILAAPSVDGFASNIIIINSTAVGDANELAGVEALPGGVVLEQFGALAPALQRGIRFGWASPVRSIIASCVVFDLPAGRLVATSSVAADGAVDDLQAVESVLASIRQGVLPC